MPLDAIAASCTTTPNAPLHLPHGGAATTPDLRHRTSPAPPCGQVQALVSVPFPRRRHPAPAYVSSRLLVFTSRLVSSLVSSPLS